MRRHSRAGDVGRSGAMDQVEEGLTSCYPCGGEQASHTFGGEIWVVQEPGSVREDEQLGEVCHRACSLLSPTIRKWSWAWQSA
jgi:hypothetical protein